MDEKLLPMPPYIYGREAAPNEKVWTESAVQEMRRACFEAGMERAAVICENTGPKEGSLKLVTDGFAAAIRQQEERKG